MESIAFFQSLVMSPVEYLAILEQLFYIPTNMLVSNYINPMFNGLVDPEAYNVAFKFFRNIFDYVTTGGRFINTDYYSNHTFKDAVADDFGVILGF